MVLIALLREGVNRLISLVEDGREYIVFMAPTGYGKTSSSPYIYRAAKNSLSTSRLIHLLPLRAILEKTYDYLLSMLSSEASIGYQAHGLGLAGKSPYFGSDVIVTTFDSFFINFYRGCVPEENLGHYEVPRIHILSSIHVFDEAHLPLESGEDMFTSLLAALYSLSHIGVPSIIETATLSLDNLVSLLEVYPSGTGISVVDILPLARYSIRRLNLGSKFNVEYEVVEDADYYDWILQTNWVYRELDYNQIRDRVIEYVDSGLSVLRVAGTVREAITEYRLLKSELGEDNTVLIHGRLTPIDRRKVVDLIGRSSIQVLVGTSAIEAGLDISYDLLITDIPLSTSNSATIPRIESLIQRMGRIRRHNPRGEGIVYFTSPPEHKEAKIYARELAEVFTSKKINPRLPLLKDEQYKSWRGYLWLLDLYKQEKRVDIDTFNKLYYLATKILLPKSVSKILESICSVTGRVLIPLIPSYNDLGISSDELLEHLDDYVIPIDNTLAHREFDRWFNIDGEVKLVRETKKDIEIVREDATSIRNALRSCSSLTYLLRSKKIRALILRDGLYRVGEGFW